MGNRQLSSRMTYEFTNEDGVHFPKVPYAGRSLLPSYGVAAQSIVGQERITVTIPIGSLASGASTTFNQTQYLANLNNITLASYDTGDILVMNVSVQSPANTLIGHPTIQPVSNQGNPVSGQLNSGQSYIGIGINVSGSVYATGASSAGNIVVTAMVLLMGSVVG